MTDREMITDYPRVVAEVERLRAENAKFCAMFDSQDLEGRAALTVNLLRLLEPSHIENLARHLLGDRISDYCCPQLQAENAELKAKIAAQDEEIRHHKRATAILRALSCAEQGTWD